MANSIHCNSFGPLTLEHLTEHVTLPKWKNSFILGRDFLLIPDIIEKILEL